MVWLRRAAVVGFGALGSFAIAAASLSPIPAAATWNAYAQTSTTDQAMTYQINPTHSGSPGPETLTTPLQPGWTVDLGGPVSYPVMGPSYVYVTVTNQATGHTQLYALNYRSGAIAWGPNDLGASYWANASYDNGLVFTVNGNGQMQAFDEQTGAVQWTTQLPGQSMFTSPPASSVFGSNGDLIYTSGAGSGGTLYAVHANSGAIAWQAPVMNGDHSAPVVTNTGIYVSYACAQTYDFEPLHGALLWHHATTCEGGGGKTAALYNGKLYVRDATVGNTILDAGTGATLGSFAATVAPAFSGSTGFFLSGSTLQAINLSTNAVVWSFTGDGTLDTAPIAVNGNVYIGASSGNLYAVDAGTGAQTWSAHLNSGISAPDEQNASHPLTGLSAGYGFLTVPAGNTLTLFGSALQVSPGSINFGVKGLGSSTSVPVGVTDNFGGSVTISSVTVTGDYAVTSNNCTSLTNSQQCQLAVSFSPAAYGQRNGTLTINDNAPGGPHTIALIGEGSDFVTDHLVLTPSPVTMAAGGSQGFEAEGYDAYGNDGGNYTPQVTFMMNGGTCTTDVCTSTKAGSTTVWAQYQAAKPAVGSASVTVTPGPLDHITISPSNTTVVAGSSQAFASEGFDQYGNDLGSATSATTFTIAPDGSCSGATCTATIAGTHTITASDSSKTAATSLAVTAGPLAALTLSPASAAIVAGANATYTATGADQYGNSLGDVTPSTTFTITPDGSCTGATCSATIAGTHTVTGTDGSTSATASLTVSSGVIDHITISPSTASVVAGGSQSFTTEAFDQYGNDLGSATGVTTFTIAPDGSCAGAACTATSAGSHTVTATDNGKSATASLTITPGPAATLTLTPASASITAGGTATYTATATDSYGNSLGDVTAATTFSITPDGACSGRFCGSTIAGPHTVTGTDGSASATASLTVTPAPVTRLALNPASATIVAGGSQAYTAVAYDQYGNSYGDVTASTTFYVDSTLNPPCIGNTCSSTVAGSHQVVGEWNTAGGSSSLTVTGGPLDHITLAPSTSTISAGGNQTYVVEAYDQYNNELGNQTNVSSLTIAPDGSCSATACSATTTGAHTVTANDSGKTATASLTVTAGSLDHISVTPATATITAGGSQAYTVEGFDAYGNDLGPMTSSAMFTITPDGSCTGATCSATKAGAHNVTATASGKSATVSLIVNGGSLDHITLSPAGSTIAAGTNQAYVVEAYDQYNNDLGNQTTASTLTISPDGSCSGGSCTATKAGAHTVTASDSGKAASASLTVSGAALDHIRLTPATATIAAAGSQAYAVEGFDVYGNDLGSFTANTSFAIAPDGNCSNAACSATKAGAHTVTATTLGKSATASLTVNAGPLAFVTVNPASVSLTVKQSQAFTAVAADAYGNPLSASGATWSLSSGTPGSISPNTGSTTTFKASDSNTGTGSIKATVSGVSGTAKVTVVPAAPTNLTATVKAPKINLTWQSASGAKTYSVYRGTSSANLVLLKSGLTSTNFTDNPGSGTFYYYVVAVGSTGLASTPSNTVTATVP